MLRKITSIAQNAALVFVQFPQFYGGGGGGGADDKKQLWWRQSRSVSQRRVVFRAKMANFSDTNAIRIHERCKISDIPDEAYFAPTVSYQKQADERTRDVSSLLPLFLLFDGCFIRQRLTTNNLIVEH
jgi:hypothetical protein